MSRITIQRQCWQRWPRVLIAERRNDDGTVDERRYVPEGGTRDEWNERTRDVMRKYAEAANNLNARLLEESELPNLQAEIDGLKWAVEERDALVRGLFSTMNTLRINGHAPTGRQLDHWEKRMNELGIDVDAHAERLRGEGE